jgi:hypothetical protein
MSCGTSDDASKITPTITTISSGSNPLVGFNYDLTTGKVELQSNQYNTLFITQISGVRNDFTIENETNTPQLSTVGVMEAIATTTLPTLNGTCKGLADSECYATFDVTFDGWAGSSPAIIGIAVDGTYVNSKALIMVNNNVETTSDKKVRILYADGVNCLFRVFALAPSLYSNTIKVYVSFYTVGTDDYSFKVQQRDYIGAISNLNVTNDSSGMPVSSWFQSIAQPSAPVLTTELTSTVTQGSTAPITSGGVYSALAGGMVPYAIIPADSTSPGEITLTVPGIYLAVGEAFGSENYVGYLTYLVHFGGTSYPEATNKMVALLENSGPGTSTMTYDTQTGKLTYTTSFAGSLTIYKIR